MSRRIFPSPAKVNLILRVIKKREDGFHDIFSVMQPVSLFDHISIEVKEGDSISVSSDRTDLPADSSNLAYRAARLFFDLTGIKKGAAIHIQKNIPVGGGLGGGSSNAATVLIGLNGLTGAGLSEKELMDESSKLGSDVPFFILKGAAVATGRGEVLKKITLPRFNYVLVNPGLHVSTAWVYNNLDLTKKVEDNILSYSEAGLWEGERIKRLLVNDLEPVTAKRYPVISELKRELDGLGALGALMSGSGPTVFGVFPDRDSALSAFKSLKGSLDKRFPVFLAEGLG
ncbi:MAG: 4-(cytidine 5'-diphospho)-2-C-methyl-D-erythritol kinase [Deltaproteobacteria bacterium]|nr:4-(cytidine 5'-diphospho)-2-C-methyl-D-erythritol kinase [Deltaproteobacteria bacterium]